MVEVYLPSRIVSLGPVLQLRLVTVRRTVYERDAARIMLVLIWLVALGSVIALYSAGTGPPNLIALAGVGIALGGAAGNLLDILRNRGVTDFIDLGWWPVFNIADAAIVAGLVLAFWPAG